MGGHDPAKLLGLIPLSVHSEYPHIPTTQNESMAIDHALVSVFFGIQYHAFALYSVSFAYTTIPTPLSRIRISLGIRENFTVTYRSPAAPDRFMSWTK